MKQEEKSNFTELSKEELKKTQGGSTSAGYQMVSAHKRMSDVAPVLMMVL